MFIIIRLCKLLRKWQEGKGKIPKVLKFRVVKSKEGLKDNFWFSLDQSPWGSTSAAGDHGCIVLGMPQFGGKETYAFRSREFLQFQSKHFVTCNAPREPEVFVTSGIHRLTGLGRQMINGSRLIGSLKIGITTLDFFLIHLSKSVEQACLEP